MKQKNSRTRKTAKKTIKSRQQPWLHTLFRKWSAKAAIVAVFLAIVGTIGLTFVNAATPSGPITAFGGKWCVDVHRAEIKSGTKVQLYTCNNTAAQQWDIDSDTTIHLRADRNYCLDVNGASTTKGTNIQLWACNGSVAQKWQQQSNSNGTRALVNPHSGMCLDDPYGLQQNENGLQIWPCNGSVAQQWSPPGAIPTPPTSATSADSGPITAFGGKWCVDVHGGEVRSGVKVQLYTCNGSGAQQWELYSDTTIHLRANRDFCLDVSGAATARGTAIQLWSCNGSAAQKWQQQTNGSGTTYALINPHANLCLDDPYGLQQNENGLQIWDCNNTTAQQWSLPKTTASTPAPAPSQPAPSPTPISGTSPIGRALYVSPSYAQAGRPVEMSSQPIAEWLGDWTPNPGATAKPFVDSAAAKGQLAQIVAYNIPHRDCGSYSAGGARDAGAYRSWIQSLASGIGNREAIVILEPDALAQITCLGANDQKERLTLIAEAVNVFKSQTKAYVYIDAGTSAWVGADYMSSLLQSANVANARGFSLNVSNFQTNASSANYGNTVSSKIGNKPYTIDTSRNGQGPGNDWCNPPGRGLGKKPTTTTNQANIDSYLWIKRPGESDGSCNGGPSAGGWFESYARTLIQNAVY